MRSHVGAMMKNVMNSESPMITWFAGAPCNDKAVRTNDRTTAIRVKQVMSRMIDGATVSNVRAKRIFTAASALCGWPPSMLKLKLKGRELVLPDDWLVCAETPCAPRHNISTTMYIQ